TRRLRSHGRCKTIGGSREGASSLTQTFRTDGYRTARRFRDLRGGSARPLAPRGSVFVVTSGSYGKGFDEPLERRSLLGSDERDVAVRPDEVGKVAHEAGVRRAF